MLPHLLLAAAAIVLVLLIRAFGRRALYPFRLPLLLLALGGLASGVIRLAGDAADPTWDLVAQAVLVFAITLISGRVVVLVLFEWLVGQRTVAPVPRVARDVVALLIYLTVAAILLKAVFKIDLGPLLATSAVITVVLGLALQQTLGSLFAGIAVGWEGRLTHGQWVRIGDTLGRVEELGWRSLVLRTLLDEHIVIPNADVAAREVTVLGSGGQAVGARFELGVSYRHPPDEVKSVLAEVLKDLPWTAQRPSPSVLVSQMADSAVVYECRVWTRQPWSEPRLRDLFYTRAHAALARAGMEIPFPQRTVHIAPRRHTSDDAERLREALGRAEIFSELPREALTELATRSRVLRFSPEEAVFHQGDESEALYVIASGEVAIVAVVEGEEVEVARLRTGEEFGDIAFLTGRARTKTVRAATALEVVQVGPDCLRGVLERFPELAEVLADRVARREAAEEPVRQRAETTTSRTISILGGFRRILGWDD